jgi:hypothetical protein
MNHLKWLLGLALLSILPWSNLTVPLEEEMTRIRRVREYREKAEKVIKECEEKEWPLSTTDKARYYGAKTTLESLK